MQEPHPPYEQSNTTHEQPNQLAHPPTADTCTNDPAENVGMRNFMVQKGVTPSAAGAPGRAVDRGSTPVSAATAAAGGRVEQPKLTLEPSSDATAGSGTQHV
jgi:hypothetical protein